MEDRTRETVRALEGRRLWGRHRAVEIEVLKFGARVETTDHRGRPCVVGEWALHLSGAWRIRSSERVIVGRPDFWIPFDRPPRDAVTVHTPGLSRRDRFMDRFMAHGEHAHLVESAAVDLFGDLRLTFADGCCLETFSDIGDVEPTEEADEECWRLFEPATDRPHLVIGPGGRTEAE